MVSKQTMTVGILAILAGLIAAYGVRSLLTQREVVRPAPPAAPVMRVPLASRELPADRVISQGDISDVQMTRVQFYERFRGQNFMLIMVRDKDIIGRRLLEPLKQGQPFLTTALYLQGLGPSLTDKLRPGFRAVSLQVTDSHGGNLQSGTRVDVLFRAKPRAARNGQPAIPEVTVTLLRHIEVLEVNRKAPGQLGGVEAKTALVTLAVPVEQAGILGAVEARGELWLAANSPEEEKGTSAKQPEGVAVAAAGGPKLTLEEILGIEMPRPPFQTAIYRRSRMQINTFVDGKLVTQRGGGAVWPSAGTSAVSPDRGTPGTAAPSTPAPDSAAPDSSAPDSSDSSDGAKPAPDQAPPADKRT
jgi:Flp pilus assembly protein CpaB